MRDLNIKECKNITGGDFWGDLTYLVASAYYDLTCGCESGSVNMDTIYEAQQDFVHNSGGNKW
jgi:hypothetical protein